MKKITLLSIVTAAMLLTGCNNSSVKEATAKASEAGSSAMDTAKEKMNQAAEAAKAKASEAMETVKEKASDAVEAAESKAKEVAAAAKEKAAEAMNSAKEKVAEATEAAKEKAAEAVETTKEKAAEAMDSAKEKAADAAEAAKAKAAEAVEATKEKAAEMTDAVEKKAAPANTERTPENPDVKPAASAADSGQGKALFAKCAGCHGSDGKTKALGKSDIIAGMDAAVIAEDIKGYKAGTLNKHGMGGIMKGQVSSLSDADISALSAYISSLK